MDYRSCIRKGDILSQRLEDFNRHISNHTVINLRNLAVTFDDDIKRKRILFGAAC